MKHISDKDLFFLSFLASPFRFLLMSIIIQVSNLNLQAYWKDWALYAIDVDKSVDFKPIQE